MSARRRIRVPALAGVSSVALAGLEADLAFCHPAIVGVASIDVGSGTIEVVSREIGGDALAELEAQVVAVVERSLKSYRFAEPTPALWSRAAGGRAGGRAALDRFAARFTRATGPGQRALLGAAAGLRAWFDRRTRRLAAEVDAEGWHLPSIEMSDDLLARTGYFASHPQLVTFGYHLPPHFEVLERFAAAARKRAPTSAEDLADLEPAGFILEPAVCHNVYRALRGERLAGGRAITALGSCYRFEGFRFEPLLRQWEFSMREVVLAGAPGWVDATQTRLVELAKAMTDELDLDARLEIATDPFFVGAAASARTFQLWQSTKLELRLALDDEATTAAASFNRHGKHFAEPMDLRIEGEIAETSCVGFGLERWMAAFVARWGDEPAGWPAAVRQAAE